MSTTQPSPRPELDRGARTTSKPRITASSRDALVRMQRQRIRDTHPELALRRELHRRGLRYRVDRTVLERSRRRHDIVFTAARVVVEVRGCYWHACPEHGSAPKANAEWWSEKLAGNVRRDADTERALQDAGWELVVVWEHEYPVEAANRVEAAVRSHVGQR